MTECAYSSDGGGSFESLRHALKWTWGTAIRALTIWGTVAVVIAFPTVAAVVGRLPWFVPAAVAVAALMLPALEGAYRAWDEAERQFRDELRERDEQFNAFQAHSAAMRRTYGSNIAPLATDETARKLAWLGERLEQGSELKPRMDAAAMGEAERIADEIDAWDEATIEGMRAQVPEFVPEYVSRVAGERDSFQHRFQAFDRYLEIKLRKLEDIRREMRGRAA